MDYNFDLETIAVFSKNGQLILCSFGPVLLKSLYSVSRTVCHQANHDIWQNT